MMLSCIPTDDFSVRKDGSNHLSCWGTPKVTRVATWQSNPKAEEQPRRKRYILTLFSLPLLPA